MLHDTPRTVADELLLHHQRDQSATPFAEPWPLPAWPKTPTRVLLSRNDKFLPFKFMRQTARDRLHLEPDSMSGDHCPMLGYAPELADRLDSYHRKLL